MIDLDSLSGQETCYWKKDCHTSYFCRIVNNFLLFYHDQLISGGQLENLRFFNHHAHFRGERNGLGRREKRPKKIGRREKGRKKNREMGELALRGRTENVLEKM